MISLAALDYLAFLTDAGDVPEQFAGQVGVYAIFDPSHTLKYVGYSRDVRLSLRQHLVHQPQQCYWVKVQTIDRPSRTTLEAIRDQWIAENGTMPAGNGDAASDWTPTIDAKARMTPAEAATLAASDAIDQVKILKQVARRVEADVLAALADRGVKMAVRFDPKLKEEGLLSLKP